jgi:peptide deformylase
MTHWMGGGTENEGCLSIETTANYTNHQRICTSPIDREQTRRVTETIHYYTLVQYLLYKMAVVAFVL